MPGEPSLDRNLTGGQILEYFAHLRGGVDQAYLKQLVERFDLDTSRKFRQYSTGNKRKVVLIQAFMHRPRLLILDEPTSGLDPLNQQEFDGMVNEARDEGRTVFLSSHVLSEVEKTCTRVGIIRDGSIVRIGGVRRGEGHQALRDHDHVRAAGAGRDVQALEGVAEVEALDDGHAVRLAMQGSADAVIKAAAQLPGRLADQPRAEPRGHLPALLRERTAAPAKEAQPVWLRSVFLKTLRDYRVAILGWGIGMGLVDRLADGERRGAGQHARRRAQQLVSLAASSRGTPTRSRPTPSAATRPSRSASSSS